MTYELAVVGGGNMGAALLGGMLRGGADPASFVVVEVSVERAEFLRTEFPGVTVVDGFDGLRCASAVIAVKPPDAVGAVAGAVAAGARRVLSIAAGVTIATLQAAAGGAAVVRSMPNTPALVGEGAAAVCPGPTASDDDIAWAESVLGAVGLVVRAREADLDAVTGLAGSGPAYLFLIAEALIDAGVAAGLSRPTSDALVRQLFVGAAALLDDRGDPAALRAMVTSPAGTTAAGLRVLEEHAVRSAVIEAVAAATRRSIELGRPTAP